ncbi:hypothetical protein BDY24DRAFT_139427 [Mrakia frigida]|uniref:uncharacterized protein n=1 Tax=Mrakia frigida TaxID=29902 RepID=UPI003FCC05A7
MQDRYASSRRLERYLSLSQIRTITTTSLSPLSAIGLSLSRSPDYLSLRLDSIAINCPTPYLRHPLIANIVGSPILPLVNPEEVVIHAIPMRRRKETMVTRREEMAMVLPKTPPSYGTSTTPPAAQSTHGTPSSSSSSSSTATRPTLIPQALLVPPQRNQTTRIHLLQLHERVETQLSSWDRLSQTSFVSCIVTDHHSILFPRGMWRLSLWREVGLTIDLSGTRSTRGEEGADEGEGGLTEEGKERTLEVWRSVRRRMEGDGNHGGGGGGWAGGGGGGGGTVEGVGDLEVLVRTEEERDWLRRKFEVWSGWKETKVLVVGGEGGRGGTRRGLS